MKLILLSIVFMYSALSYSLSVGDTLSPLSFTAKPNDFHYAANGEIQLITLYPAKLSSKKNGALNLHAQEKGICPKAITDINNKAWYAPVSVIEHEMKKEVASSGHNTACSISGDYDGIAAKTWGLKPESVTMVVDGSGRIVFMAYGVLNDEQEAAVFALFDVKNKSIE